MATGPAETPRPKLRLRRILTAEGPMTVVEAHSMLQVIDSLGYEDLAAKLAGGILVAETEAALRGTR